ncbi:hypothetical protein AWB98_20195 [Mycolicibacterium conceptionense]|uniref:Uncharacterized protein n=1 Tax=Mycolicibacterium conceptionense TaxID=451644 RepID=A0ABX3V462_9MYCO|nr:hypothetical protein AWB98_20195 [Mycolicibacterium conceptionense]
MVRIMLMIRSGRQWEPVPCSTENVDRPNWGFNDVNAPTDLDNLQQRRLANYPQVVDDSRCGRRAHRGTAAGGVRLERRHGSGILGRHHDSDNPGNHDLSGSGSRTDRYRRPRRR